MYMAMPSGNVVVPDKMHDGGAVVGGVEMMNYTQYQRQWVPDEREGFIRWIRCEFAAANAIIDSLCHHLKAIGEPGEYDGVIGNVQQRRANWHHILHMQQYYSVSEVVHSLQQVAWRRQQQRHHHNHRYSDPVKVQGKRFGGGSRQGHHRGVDYYSQEANAGSERGEKVSEKRDEEDVGSEIAKDDDKGMVHVEGKNGAGMSAKHQLDCSSNSFGNSQTNISATSEYQAEVVDNKLTSDSKGSCDVPLENGSPASQFVREKHIISNSVKTFVGTEILDGKSVNSVDGMKLYEELLDDFEVAKLVSMVNDMRTAGRKGQFQGQTFIVSKRPMRGHGREMIQLGVPLADAPPEDEITVGTSKDRRIEPIPDFMHNVIERLMALEVITVKPDSCIIDVYNEGDHSQPHMWSYWFGRPVCVLFLTECDMTFGKVITVDQPGDYKGSIKLSFTPGSMLVMQGRSSDFARHAIPSIGKQRILVTLTKSQPKKSSDGPVRSFATAPPPSQWVPPPRSANSVRHPMVPKHYIPVPSTRVLPAPPIRAQLPPSGGVQPIFVPTVVAQGMHFPAPVAVPPTSAGWSVALQMHPAPHVPLPGTGVFLPPDSGNLMIQPSSVESLPTEANAPSKNINGLPKPNGYISSFPNEEVDGKVTGQDCNRNVDEASSKGLVKEDQQQRVDLKMGGEPAGTV